jgi:hypothetical protein
MYGYYDSENKHSLTKALGLGLLGFVVGLALGYFWAWSAMGGTLN